MFCNHILNVVVAQRAHNHCHSCSHRAIIHAFTLGPAGRNDCALSSSLHFIYLLILVCECVFTIDVFGEAFNMILGECRDNYRTIELTHNECYPNHPQKFHTHFVI